MPPWLSQHRCRATNSTLYSEYGLQCVGAIRPQRETKHMKTQNIVIGSALAVALASGAAAQQSGNTSNNRDNQQSRNGSVTVTGCLQSSTAGLAGGAGAGGAASSTSRSSAGDHFMLTNASMGSSA